MYIVREVYKSPRMNKESFENLFKKNDNKLSDVKQKHLESFGIFLTIKRFIRDATFKKKKKQLMQYCIKS